MAFDNRHEGASESFSTISRRSSLKLLAGTGGLAISPLTVMGGNKTSYIPWKVSRGEVEYKEVPPDWKEHFEHAKSAKDEFTSKYHERDDVKAVGLVKSETGYGLEEDLDGFDIMVVISEEDSSDDMPNDFDNINVQYNVGDIGLSDSEPSDSLNENGCSDIDACYNKVEPNAIYGGTPTIAHQDGSWLDFGTLGTNAYMDGVGTVGITAHHLLPLGGCPDPYYPATWTQYCRDYGSQEDYDNAMDVHVIEFENTSRSPNAEILEASNGLNQPMVVDGHHLLSGIAYLAENNETIRKTGVRTGTTTGPIDMFDFSYDGLCNTTGHDGVKIDADVANRDSGAMAYRISNSFTITLVSMVVGDPSLIDENGSEESSCPPSPDPSFIGPATYAIADEWDIDFSTT